MAKQVRKLHQRPQARTKKLRVVDYVRVSMQSEDLLRSYARQVDYYTKLISNNPEWELAGIFSDKGIIGTNAEKRDGFLEMLDACEKGQIDIILCKSISRFARNMVDLLNTIRHLKELGIEVWFEKENIHSLSGDGDEAVACLIQGSYWHSVKVYLNRALYLLSDTEGCAESFLFCPKTAVSATMLSLKGVRMSGKSE